MAKLYIQQKMQDPPDWDEKNTHVYITHQLGNSFSRSLLRTFKGINNVDIIEEELSLGGGGAASVMQIIYSGVVFSVMLMAQGFLQEVGSSGAKKIIKSLKRKHQPSTIIVSKNKSTITFRVILPTQLSEKECQAALKTIDEEFSKEKSKKKIYRNYSYDKKNDRLVEIETLEW